MTRAGPPAPESGDRLTYNPVVDHGHQAVALGGGEKRARRQQAGLRVFEPEKHLPEGGLADPRPGERQDRLGVETELALLQRPSDAGGPVDSRAVGGGDLLQPGDVNAVPPRVLGPVARCVGGPEGVRLGLAGGGDLDQTDTDAEAERVLLPGEAKV